MGQVGVWVVAVVCLLIVVVGVVLVAYRSPAQRRADAVAQVRAQALLTSDPDERVRLQARSDRMSAQARARVDSGRAPSAPREAGRVTPPSGIPISPWFVDGPGASGAWASPHLDPGSAGSGSGE